jgi:diguanylate cyclase (GGDEF)-like protein/hemerythrin-like metal-binding protein
MNHDSGPPSRTRRDRIDPRALGSVLVNSKAIALAALRHGLIVFANPAFLATFRTTNALVGTPLADIVVDAGGDQLADTLLAAEHAPTRYYGAGKRGEDPSFDLELSLECTELDGEPTIVAFACDVTRQHRSREQLANLAYNDALTGLANRALFADHLHQAVQHARRHPAIFAVLVMDLDGFKAINDTYGHQMGDVALQLVAQRFEHNIREGDTLARIGGDEFAVLLPRLHDQQAAGLVAQRMIGALAAPLDLATHRVGLGTSVGIAAWPAHAGSADALLAAADTAMYRAKRVGRNQFRWATGRSAADIVSLQPLAWSAVHAIGIEEIDDQHMHLAELIDELSAELKGNFDGNTIAAKMSDLTQYTAFHFATEERLMEQHQVEDLVRHREEHRRLLHDVQNLQVDGDLVSVSLVVRYLQEWLLRHVDGPDRQLGQALIAKGCR